MAPDDGPESILILGAGVFGLSMLYELLQRLQYKSTRITLLAPSVPSSHASPAIATNGVQGTSAHDLSAENRDPASPIASNDTNRIIRPDYSAAAYQKFASEAVDRWCTTEWGQSSRFNQTGLVLTSDPGTPGSSYLREALANAREIGLRVRDLNSAAAVEEALRAPGAAVGSGGQGYVNEESGWADAGATIAWLWEKIIQIVRSEQRNQRIAFIRATAARLIVNSDHNEVLGARTIEGEEILASRTVLATGAWTPALLDCRGIASARAQCILYVGVTEVEKERLKNMPIMFDLGIGTFCFPPTGRWKDDAEYSSTNVYSQYEVKVARHAFGYTNPGQPVSPLLVSGQHPDEPLTSISIPSFPSRLPKQDSQDLLSFLGRCIPLLADIDPASPVNKEKGSSRPIVHRLCWYLDTPEGDFLVSPHPSFGSSLFVATGGSGHAFKFFPVIGKQIVDIFEGAGQDGGWRKKWAWPAERAAGDEVWCSDGSRAGKPGAVLKDALMQRID